MSSYSFSQLVSAVKPNDLILFSSINEIANQHFMFRLRFTSKRRIVLHEFYFRLAINFSFQVRTISNGCQHEGKDGNWTKLIKNETVKWTINSPISSPHSLCTTYVKCQSNKPHHRYKTQNLIWNTCAISIRCDDCNYPDNTIYWSQWSNFAWIDCFSLFDFVLIAAIRFASTGIG